MRVLPDAGALTAEALERVLAAAEEAVRARRTFRIALSGGDTPRALHLALAGSGGARASFPRWEVFFGDERWVPADDPASNLRMARETLLDHAPIPAASVHPIPTELASPAEAARAYERTLRARLGDPPRLDLVLLGLGADGHTASLFPGEPALDARGVLVAPARVPATGQERVTLTFEALAAARRVLFLVSGAAKAPALRAALAGEPGATPPPAARVRPRDGGLLWLVDRAAASLLPGSEGP